MFWGLSLTLVDTVLVDAQVTRSPSLLRSWWHFFVTCFWLRSPAKMCFEMVDGSTPYLSSPCRAHPENGPEGREGWVDKTVEKHGTSSKEVTVGGVTQYVWYRVWKERARPDYTIYIMGPLHSPVRYQMRCIPVSRTMTTSRLSIVDYVPQTKRKR